MSIRVLLLATLIPLRVASADTPAAAPAPAEPAPAAATPAAPADPTPAAAPADAAPTPPPPGALTLRAGAFQIAATFELEASANKVGKPFSLAPDLSYGVTSDLTVAVLHSKYALTGFRAAAGGALCLAGSENGCAAVYNNVGGEAWYTLARGPATAAIVAGVHAVDLDRGFYDVKLGAKARYTAGALAIITQPSVLIAASKRTDDAGARLNKDLLYVPIVATYKVAPPIALGLGTGIKGPLSGFGDAWQIPLGFLVQYTVSPALGCGASWVFGQLLGGATNPPDPAPAVKGPDLRGVQVWASYTL